VSGQVEEVVAWARDAHAREVEVVLITLKDVFLDAATPHRLEANHASL
jgi:DNA-binding MurR/RpiR family transcriptional regulator